MYTSKEKVAFVNFLFASQENNESKGYGLRHVQTDSAKNQNIEKGFFGDAYSYAISNYIMQLVLDEPDRETGLIMGLSASGERQCGLFSRGEFKKRATVDEELAVRIFDTLHKQLLISIETALCFKGDAHHFFIVKNMNRAQYPLDFPEGKWQAYYGTGKCGKQEVSPDQIVGVISNNNQFNDPEEILALIETEMFRLSKLAPQKPSKPTPEMTYIYLESAIGNMKSYGIRLRDKNHSTKGKVVIELAESLTGKLNAYKNDKSPNKSFTSFETDFKKELKSKDKEMGRYRKNWPTIVTNILIALTGVGLFAIAGKLIHSKVTQKRPLFFKQKSSTTSEKAINAVAKELDNVAKHHAKK